MIVINIWSPTCLIGSILSKFYSRISINCSTSTNHRNLVACLMYFICLCLIEFRFSIPNFNAVWISAIFVRNKVRPSSPMLNFLKFRKVTFESNLVVSLRTPKKMNEPLSNDSKIFPKKSIFNLIF